MNACLPPENKRQVPRPTSAIRRLLLAINCLAGLLHDTGKASLAFKKKLHVGSGAEAIRHDLMSFLILADSLLVPGGSDVGWLHRLAENPGDACACVKGTQLLSADSPWLAKVKLSLESDEASLLLAQGELERLDKTSPVLSVLLWLVLTHHRLPRGDRSAQQLDPGGHVNRLRDGSLIKIAPLEECLLRAAGVAPWEDAEWLAAVASAAKEALSALAELPASPALPPYFWPQVAAHQLRPQLILADHLGSLQSVKSHATSSARAKKEIFANQSEPGWYGDTLTTHELKVAGLTTKIADISCSQGPTTQLPLHSLALKQDLAPAYAWQADLGRACEQARSIGPSFVSIIAETGAGKTLAAARALHYLSEGGRVRATFALGLRSLTSQLGDAMLRDAEFPVKDVLVAVGHPETLGLAEQARRNMEDQMEASAPRFGSESSSGRELEADRSPQAEPDHSWLAPLCSQVDAEQLFGAKALDILSSPLVACTADHLVASVSLLKGGDAKMSLRLATGDLVLDEIDAYSAEDLQSIAKLAYASGISGRHVLVMSATMTPPVHSGLYGAWRKGLAIYHAVNDLTPAYANVFASNTCPPEVLDSPADAPSADAWRKYVTAVAKSYAARLSQRLMLAVHSLASTTEAQAREELASIAQALHADNCVVDAATGNRVSVGFIRFKTAKSAWRMAQYLTTRPRGAGPVIRFVSYHAKMPRNYLGVLDATLGQLTNRKPAEDGSPGTRFLETPSLRRVLSEYSGQDVITIVCTTTLIETGRDFDFDWGILEPRSVRGEVQAGGRIGRHRWSMTATRPNVVLLDRPLSSIENPKTPSWGWPGIEDSLAQLKVTFSVPPVSMAGAPVSSAGTSAVLAPTRAVRAAPLGSGGPVKLAVDALPVRQWKVALDAQQCLLPCENYGENRIGYLEQAVQRLNLLAGTWDSSSRWSPAVSFYLNSWAPWNDKHASLTRFRGVDGGTALFIPEGEKAFYWDSEVKVRRTARCIRHVSAPGENALVPDLEYQAGLLPVTSEHMVACSLRCELGGGSTKAAAWSPLLGFLEE